MSSQFPPEESSTNYNVSDYTTDELLSLLGFTPDQNVSDDDIVNATNVTMESYTQNPSMVTFLQQIQTRLLLELDEQQSQTTTQWIQHGANLSSPTLRTQRDSTAQTMLDPSGHFPMQREQLDMPSHYQVPVAQDKLNPKLENVFTRFVNLDSQFRQSSTDPSTDYTLEVNDSLVNVLSMRLYSIQIPFTWYVIDCAFNNNVFWITTTSTTTFTIEMPSGNYTPTTFVEQLNTVFQQVGFVSISSASPSPSIVSYNSASGILSMTLSNVLDPSGNLINTTQDGTTYFTFFDPTMSMSMSMSMSTNSCLGASCSSTSMSTTMNNTLGWLMGYRYAMVMISTTNQADAIMDLFGPKYFILALDDFNQNHINSGLVTITQPNRDIALPSYYHPSDQPIQCIDPTYLDLYQHPGLLQTYAPPNMTGDAFINLMSNKENPLTYRSIPQVGPSAPRTLTQAQIYTINAIMKARVKTTNYMSRAPTVSDTFALIPLKRGGKTGDVYTDFSGSLQDNKRTYFGPVNIDRMRLKLLDDKGRVVLLHGGEWCITLLTEHLYQY